MTTPMPAPENGSAGAAEPTPPSPEMGSPGIAQPGGIDAVPRGTGEGPAAGPHRPGQPGPAAPDRPPAAAPGRPPRPPVPSRVGAAWLAAIMFALVLLFLLIFILQNGQTVEVSFFGAHGHIPMGIALLLAAIFGVLLVAIPGSARIVQLRIRDRRHRRASTRPDSSGH